MSGPFEIMVGRIETLALDAVVNAAKRQLAPGSGADGALRAAAGPRLTEATNRIPPILPLGGSKWRARIARHFDWLWCNKRHRGIAGAT